MKKKEKTLTIVLALILLLSIVGITYAYFIIDTNTRSKDIRVATGTTILVLEDVDPITQLDTITPNNLTIERYLKIRNDGTLDGYAKLYLKS